MEVPLLGVADLRRRNQERNLKIQHGSGLLMAEVVSVGGSLIRDRASVEVGVRNGVERNRGVGLLRLT